jgi:Fe-S oxidoreductase
MLHRKAAALGEALVALPPDGDARVLTNCPSCLQGLGRSAHLGFRPVHLAVELAERTDGPAWKEVVQRRLDEAEIVAF